MRLSLAARQMARCARCVGRQPSCRSPPGSARLRILWKYTVALHGPPNVEYSGLRGFRECLIQFFCSLVQLGGGTIRKAAGGAHGQGVRR